MLLTILCAGTFTASAEDVDIRIPEQERPTAANKNEGQPGLAEGTKLQDLPAPVIQRVKQYPLQIADIDIETWKGERVYEIEFKTQGGNKRIHVMDNGSLVKDTEKEGDTLWGVLLGTQLRDLPPLAQDAIEGKVGKGVIVDIDRANFTGDPQYEVTYKSQTGPEKKFRVAGNGSIINEAAGSENRVLDLGADGKVNFDQNDDPKLKDLPPKVQQAVRQTDNGKIVDVDVKDEGGKKVYEVDFQRDGINRRVEFNANGSVIKDNKRD